MNNEPCIKITPARVFVAGLGAVIFGVAALASPSVIKICVAAFLICCISLNVYLLRAIQEWTEAEIDI